jgi:hypothetical protein
MLQGKERLMLMLKFGDGCPAPAAGPVPAAAFAVPLPVAAVPPADAATAAATMAAAPVGDGPPAAGDDTICVGADCRMNAIHPESSQRNNGLLGVRTLERKKTFDCNDV